MYKRPVRKVSKKRGTSSFIAVLAILFLLIPPSFARAHAIEHTLILNPAGGAWSDGSLDERGVLVEKGEQLNFSERFGEMPTKSGYYIEGWYLDSNFENDDKAYTSEDTMGIEKLILYARWALEQPEAENKDVDDEKEVKVVFNLNNNEEDPISTITVPYNTTLGEKMPETPIKEGYNFVGWFDLSGIEVTCDTLVCEDLLVVGRWEETLALEEVSKTITFDANALVEDVPTKITVPTGGTINDNSEETIPVGVTLIPNTHFAGWYTSPDPLNRGELFTANTIVNSDITVYAHLYVNASFNGNGGTPEEAIVSVPYNTSIDAKMPADPKREGYNFAGWFNTNDESNGILISGETVVAEDTTFFARWEPAATVDSYTVSFNGNGMITEQQSGSITVPVGKTISDIGMTTPNAISMFENVDFAGWYTNNAPNARGELFTADTVVTGNITVYAHLDVSVTFVGNGGTPNELTIKIPYDSKFGNKMPDKPIYGDYVFVGWFDSAESYGGIQLTKDTVVKQNSTVYARWKKKNGLPVDPKETENKSNNSTSTPRTGDNNPLLSIWLCLLLSLGLLLGTQKASYR